MSRRYTSLADRAALWATWGSTIRRLQSEPGYQGRAKGPVTIARELAKDGASISSTQVEKLIREADEGKYLETAVPVGDAEATVKVTRNAEGDVVTVRSKTVRTLDQFVQAADIDLDQWDIVDFRPNKWDVASRNPNTGELEVAELWQCKATLRPSMASLVERVPPVPFDDIPRAPAGMPGAVDETWVFIPDTQHGFRWNDNHTELAPMHDPIAIDAVRQLCALLQPNGIAWLGDHADLAEAGTYRTHPSVRQTTTPSLRALAWDILETRRVCPHTRMDYLGGNHDERPVYRVQESIPGLAALADEKGNHPFSIPSLLRLDEMGVTYHPYKERLWVWGQVMATHGDDIKPASTKVKELSHSLVHGHTHKRGIESKVIHGPDSQREVFVASPGSLVRNAAGSLPGVQRYQNNQQGVLVVHLINGRVHPELLRIEDGALVYGGAIIRGRNRSEEIAAFAGYPQIAAWRPAE